jgi:hypothetical protein
MHAPVSDAPTTMERWRRLRLKGRGNAEDAHLVLGWDSALEALDLDAHVPVRELPPEAEVFFWADDQHDAPGRFAVLVVLEGEGSVAGERARPGDAFAVPAAARDLDVEGFVRLLRCVAPAPAL